jgi:hypothetical protein
VLPLRDVSKDRRFFLSEMGASHRHGGGLTLWRILGTDLERVDRFIHLHQTGVNAPPPAFMRDRVMNRPLWTETDAGRRALGLRITTRLNNARWWRRRHARRVANEIVDLADKGRWLICPQGSLSLTVTENLKKRGNLDYVTWMMDDHLVQWKNNWRYHPEDRRIMQSHLRDAHAVFTISPAMSEFYAAEFGISSTPLFGPADTSGEPLWHPVSAAPDPIRLGYFGAVTPWQADALELLLPFVRAGKAELTIHSINALPKEWNNIPGLSHRGAVAADEIGKGMKSYDAVILPASFASSQAHLTRLNIATKMAECLASGTVTLLIGPPEAAMARYLLGRNVCLQIATPEREAVEPALNKIRDTHIRLEILGNARQFVAEQLSSQSMRSAWSSRTSNWW